MATDTQPSAFRIHHPDSLYAICQIEGEFWVCWKRPDGKWLTQQSVRLNEPTFLSEEKRDDD